MTLLTGVLLAALGGCGDTASRPVDQRGGLPALGRSRIRSDAAPAVVLARRGESGPIIVPIRPTDAAIARGSVPLELSDAESVVAPLRFVVELPATGAPTALASTWFGPQSTWRSYRPSERPRDAAGVWVVECELGEREPKQLRIDGRTIVLRWSSAAESVDASVDAVDRPTVAAALSDRARSPLDRWRVRLSRARAITGEFERQDRIDDPILDGLARQVELQWEDALRRVDQADPAVGRRLRKSLAGVVTIDGVSVPIWTESREQLESLRRELLAEGLSSQEVLEIASAHLAAPAIEGAIVRDDAAAVNLKLGAAYPSVLVANLSSSPAAAWLGRRQPVRGTGAPGDMLRLEPLTGQTVTFPGESRALGTGDDSAAPKDKLAGVDASRLTQPSDASKPDVLRFECGVGEWIGERVAVGRIAPVRPPGITIGPLLGDWNQLSFTRALIAPSPTSPMPAFDPTRAVLGRLFRSAEAGERWMLYLECDSPAEAQPDRSIIAVYLGPQARATRIEVSLADGTMREFRGGKEASSGRAAISRSAGKASIWITIPADAIETTLTSARASGPSKQSEGLIRLGLSRSVESPEGKTIARGAWPRPMFPWDQEPSRVALDLSTWVPTND